MSPSRKKRPQREHVFSNRQRALRKAKSLIRLALKDQPSAFVQFYSQCSKCGALCEADKPNEAPLFAQCFSCGRTTKVEKLAFKIFYKKEETGGPVHEAGESLQAGDTRGESGGGSDSAAGDREV